MTTTASRYQSLENVVRLNIEWSCVRTRDERKSVSLGSGSATTSFILPFARGRWRSLLTRLLMLLKLNFARMWLMFDDAARLRCASGEANE